MEPEQTYVLTLNRAQAEILVDFIGIATGALLGDKETVALGAMVLQHVRNVEDVKAVLAAIEALIPK